MNPETPKRPRTDGKYRQVGTNSIRLHRLRAELALGKSLPKGAEVHHADGTKADNAPLVICENKAYHLFLHVRMRVKAVGGNPNTQRICSACKELRLFSEMLPRKDRPLGLHSICYKCHYIKRGIRRRRKRFLGLTVK